MDFKLTNLKFDKQDKRVLSGIILYFMALVFIAVNTNGTCDAGDSITHFLFSKYAFKHPENFLNHWAKPLFVLLSAPFAQLGFIGIKLFNCIIAAFSAWFSFKIAKKLNFRNAWLAALFLCFTPGYFIHIFSGLTEPLFGLMLLMGIYWTLNQTRIRLAVCIISFLPFVRSEGLIIIGIFAFYLLINKQYKHLPWLLLGHVVYSIAGSFYYQDLLWVFTKIPYSGSSGKYGNGALTHFIIQLNYIIGVPIYILLILGFTSKLFTGFIRKKIETLFFTNTETVLIYALFLAFIAAHTLFWHFGLFESMGLKRVLICITPLAAIIAVNGLNFVTGIFKSKNYLYYTVSIAFVGFVVLFPFVHNPASVNWSKDMSLSADEVLIARANESIQTNFSEKNIFMYYTHPYYSMVADRDPYDTLINGNLKTLGSDKRPAHYLVIWDNWFSVVENGISLEQLRKDTKLKELTNLQEVDKDREMQVVVFEGSN